MSAEKGSVTAPRVELQETPDPEAVAVSVSEKTRASASSTLAVQARPCSPASQPRPDGVLRDDTVQLSRDDGSLSIVRQVVLNGIPIAGIMFLDIANSADFPANVFNDRPVPLFAIILMAIGATFALVMSCFAFVDARRSWRTIKQICAERMELRKRDATCENSADPMLASFLHLNRRDFGTELFERFGMEMSMGTAAFIISVGTYMAIGGDNYNVYIASNYLSGYIGNALPCFYGLVNIVWSFMIFNRARRQRLAGRRLQETQYARGALNRRARMIQYHALYSGLACLISGALGMVTPTQWEPYPPLAVFNILFMYAVHLFRKKIAYVRAPLSAYRADITTADLAHEIDQLLSLQTRTVESKKNALIDPDLIADRDRLESQLRLLTMLGSLERFSKKLLKTAKFSPDRTAPIPVFVDQLYKSDTTTLTPALILAHANTISNDPELDIGQEIYQALDMICCSCLSKKAVLERISMRSKFLTELLGSHLISFPDDLLTYSHPA